MGTSTSSYKPKRSCETDLSQQITNRYPPMPQPLVREFRFGMSRGELRSAKGVTATCEEPNTIYVADLGNQCIRVFNEDMEYQFQFGKNMHAPVYVHVCRHHVFVSNYFTYRVSVYTLDGIFITFIGNSGKGKGKFLIPSGMFLDKQNEELYICDTNNHRVQIFSDIGIDILPNGGDSLPFDVKGSAKEIFVLDLSDITVKVYSLGAEHLRTITFRDKSKFETSYYLAVDIIGNIFIPTIRPNAVLILNKDGDLIQKIVQEREENVLANSLTLDGSGRLVIIGGNDVNMIMSILY